MYPSAPEIIVVAPWGDELGMEYSGPIYWPGGLNIVKFSEYFSIGRL